MKREMELWTKSSKKKLEQAGTGKSLEAAWVRSTHDFAHWVVVLCFHWLL